MKTTETPDLDALLTPEECAAWLKISRRKLMENTRAGLIPAVRVNGRVIRFHPRTMLHRLSKS